MLGLCIGFSLCSVIELIYWFGYKLGRKIFGCEKKSDDEEEQNEMSLQKDDDSLNELRREFEVWKQVVREMKNNRDSNATSYSSLAESRL